MELRRRQAFDHFAPFQRRGDRRAVVRAKHVGRGDGFASRDLQVIEIDFAFFPPRHGAGSSEQIGSVMHHQARQNLGERPSLGIAVTRLDGNVNMHAIAAGGLGISGQPQQIQFLPDQLRGFHDAVVAAVARIKVNEYEVGIVE